MNGNQSDNSAPTAGAAYVFSGFGHGPSLVVRPDGVGGYILSADAVPFVRYVLQRAGGVTGAWSAILTNTAPATGLLEFHDTNPLPGRAFYRTSQP